MASTRTAMRRAAPQATTLRSSRTHTRRPFFSIPGTSSQVLRSNRILPYAPGPLYDLIADVDSYKRFLPYCKVSRVTHWTPPDADGRRWPTQADLTAGWGGYVETYTSRLFCIPGHIVEAVSGDGRTELSAATLHRWGLEDKGPLAMDEAGKGVFKSLVTRWTLTPLNKASRAAQPEGDCSQVDLSIRYQFRNPVYNAVSSAVADQVALLMVEAFVAEAERVLGKPMVGSVR